MTTTLSSKGQVVLPQMARAKLHLVTGSKLVCEVRDGSIILKPQSPRNGAKKIITDEVTGLKVTQRTKDGPMVTTELVKALLVDFP